jgi:hypothetical protein
MAAVVKAATEAIQSGKRKLEQRTPNSQNVKRTGYPPAATKKPFRQLRWKNVDASEEWWLSNKYGIMRAAQGRTGAQMLALLERIAGAE